MITRFNILFDNKLRERMEQDPKVLHCPGIQEAIEFANLALMVYIKPPSSFFLSDHFLGNGSLNKWFSDGCSRKKDLLEWFERASRIHVVISIANVPVEGWLQLHLLFFTKQSKQPFADFEAKFREQGGGAYSIFARDE